MTLNFGEVLHGHTHKDEADSPHHKAGIKKQLIDRLVALGAFPESAERDTHVNEIIEELRSDVDAGSVEFKDLDQLATLARQHPDRLDEITPTMTDTAEILLTEIKTQEEQERRLNIGIHVVWSALNAWDELRVEATEQLATELLDNFWGGGRDQLKRAQEIAKKKDIPFGDALDQVNQSYAA